MATSSAPIGCAVFAQGHAERWLADELERGTAQHSVSGGSGRTTEQALPQAHLVQFCSPHTARSPHAPPGAQANSNTLAMAC